MPPLRYFSPRHAAHDISLSITISLRWWDDALAACRYAADTPLKRPKLISLRMPSLCFDSALYAWHYNRGYFRGRKARCEAAFPTLLAYWCGYSIRWVHRKEFLFSYVSRTGGDTPPRRARQYRISFRPRQRALIFTRRWYFYATPPRASRPFYAAFLWCPDDILMHIRRWMFIYWWRYYRFIKSLIWF